MDVFRGNGQFEVADDNVFAELKTGKHKYFVAPQGNEYGPLLVTVDDTFGHSDWITVTKAMKDDTLVSIVEEIIAHYEEVRPLIYNVVTPRLIRMKRLPDGKDGEVKFKVKSVKGNTTYCIPDKDTASLVSRFGYTLEKPDMVKVQYLAEHFPRFRPSGTGENAAGFYTTSPNDIPAFLLRIAEEYRERISPVRYANACGNIRNAQMFLIDEHPDTTLKCVVGIINHPFTADDMIAVSKSLASRITVCLRDTYQTVCQEPDLADLIDQTVHKRTIGINESGEDVIVTGKVVGVTVSSVVLETLIPLATGQKIGDAFGHKGVVNVIPDADMPRLKDGTTIHVLLSSSDKRGNWAALIGKKRSVLAFSDGNHKAWVGPHNLLFQSQNGWGQSSWAIKQPRLLCNSTSTGVALTYGGIVKCLELFGLNAYDLFCSNEEVMAQAKDATKVLYDWLHTVPTTYPGYWLEASGRWTRLAARNVGLFTLVPEPEFHRMEADNWLPDHEHTVKLENGIRPFQVLDKDGNEVEPVTEFIIPRLCDNFKKLLQPTKRFKTDEPTLQTVYKMPSIIHTMWMAQQTEGEGQAWWIQKFKTALLLLLGKGGIAHNLLSPRVKGGWLTALAHCGNPDTAFLPLSVMIDLGIQPGDWVVIGRMPTTDGQELAAVRVFPSNDATPHIRVHWELLDVAFKGDCDGDGLYLLKLRSQDLASSLSKLVPSNRKFGNKPYPISTADMDATKARFEFLSKTDPIGWVLAQMAAKKSIGTIDRTQFVLFEAAQELGLPNAADIFRNIGACKAAAIDKYSTASVSARQALIAPNLHLTIGQMCKCLDLRFEKFEMKGSTAAWYGLESGNDWFSLSIEAKHRWLVKKLFLTSKLSLVSTRRNFRLSPLEWILQFKVLKSLNY